MITHDNYCELITHYLSNFSDGLKRNHDRYLLLKKAANEGKVMPYNYQSIIDIHIYQVNQFIENINKSKKEMSRPSRLRNKKKTRKLRRLQIEKRRLLIELKQLNQHLQKENILIPLYYGI